MLATICDPDIVEAIKKLDWPQTHCYDKLLWIANKKGIFSVKDVYLVTDIGDLSAINLI